MNNAALKREIQEMDDRAFGRLEGRFDGMEKTVADIKSHVDKIDTNLTEMNNMLSQAQGGWKMLMWVSGFSAGVGAAVAKFFMMLKGGS